MIDETTSDYDREELQGRLAKLVGGVAVIKVGAATETELRKRRRASDAMHARKAPSRRASSLAEGGAVARLQRASRVTLRVMSKWRSISSPCDREPMRWIATNAGTRDPIWCNA